MIGKGGISGGNRQLLERLHREAATPFSLEEAAELLGLEHDRARRLLAHLASRGWLVRVRRGLYAPVPLEATRPSEWQVDPWAIAARTFAPCYVGGWSACEHWGLTEQLFRVVVVLTVRHIRERTPRIQQSRFRVKTITQARMFGTRPVWRGSVQVPVSDPTRTIVDLLDDPSLFGGIRHGAEVLGTYFEELPDEDLLLEYLERFGNRTAYKRLGFLLERLELGREELREACAERLSTGYSLLDPSAPADGPYDSRWNLRLNVTLETEKP